jgi:hypothetical protein
MGAHRFERHTGRRTVGFAAFAAMCCLACDLPVSAQASSSPVIEWTNAWHVTQNDATLGAKINPEDLPEGVYYQFQVVKNTSEYLPELACPESSVPPYNSDGCGGPDSGPTTPGALPIGFIEKGSGGRTVGLDLAMASMALKSGTTYHYRVLAVKRRQSEDTLNWEGPPAVGPDQTFTTPPAIEGESVSNITATDATIEAQINTGGRETTYRVWVGNYPECIEEMVEECESSAKHPIVGTIAAGSSSPASISVDVAKAWRALSPGSSYIYNVDATNSNWAYEGSAYGENKTFTTPAAKAPAIDSESVSHVTPTDATLEAQINTEGLETSYEFHLATPPCPSGCEHLQFSFPLPSGKLLGSSVTQSVSLDLNSAGVTLTPGQRYEYWVTATNAAGTVSTLSEEKTFAATEDGVQPLNITTPPSTTGPATNSGQGTVTPAGTGGSTPAVDAASKPAHGKPSTKHGKRRKHQHHGKHLGKGHKKNKKH